MSYRRDLRAGLGDGIERKPQPPGAEEQVALARERRNQSLEVRRDDRAAGVSQSAEKRQVALWIASGANGKDHDVGTGLGSENCDLERLFSVPVCGTDVHLRGVPSATMTGPPRRITLPRDP
jgi:hypothetical protein